MSVDTTSMREIINSTPGTRMAMEKIDFAALLDVVDAGQAAERTLADLRQLLAAPHQRAAA